MQSAKAAAFQVGEKMGIVETEITPLMGGGQMVVASEGAMVAESTAAGPMGVAVMAGATAGVLESVNHIQMAMDNTTSIIQLGPQSAMQHAQRAYTKVKDVLSLASGETRPVTFKEATAPNYPKLWQDRKVGARTHSNDPYTPSKPPQKRGDMKMSPKKLTFHRDRRNRPNRVYLLKDHYKNFRYSSYRKKRRYSSY